MTGPGQFPASREPAGGIRNKPYRWVTPAGEQTAELRSLIERGRTGERWEDIAATFYPASGNGIRKSCDAFTLHSSEADKQERRAALVRCGFNRRTGARNPRTFGGGVTEPALALERRDPWAGMGLCFATPARQRA